MKTKITLDHAVARSQNPSGQEEEQQTAEIFKIKIHVIINLFSRDLLVFNLIILKLPATQQTGQIQ